MNRLNITTIAAAIALALSTGAIAQSLSKDDYKAGKDKIVTEYKSSKAACGSLSGNTKDICVVEAKNKEKVATAELEASYKPSVKASHAVIIAKAEAEYAIAKEKCDDKSGNDKTACVKEAKTAETIAKTHVTATAPPSAFNASNTPAKEKSTVSSTKKESAGEYVEDAVITTKVKAAVLEESSLKSAEINVETNKGIVQLTGFVGSRAEIDKAVAVAGSVKGVASVKNDMIVKGKQ
jgi:osmotically-inducible protein OsmY